tara:strand:- start:399 stop:1052 length:654 start_codon:yes stop_codon:yes gene_type:complete
MKRKEMAGTQKRISDAAVVKINAEKRRQTGLGLPQPTDAQALDALLGIEPVKPATRGPVKNRKKTRKPPAKPSAQIIDSFIIWAFKLGELQIKGGNPYIKRVILCDWIRDKFIKGVTKGVKGWADLYPEFMKDSNKDDSPFRNHISYRLKALTEMGILGRIPQDHTDITRRGTYGLAVSATTGDVLLTGREKEIALAVITLTPDLDLVIPQFLTKKD